MTDIRDFGRWHDYRSSLNQGRLSSCNSEVILSASACHRTLSSNPVRKNWQISSATQRAGRPRPGSLTRISTHS